VRHRLRNRFTRESQVQDERAISDRLERDSEHFFLQQCYIPLHTNHIVINEGLRPARSSKFLPLNSLRRTLGIWVDQQVITDQRTVPHSVPDDHTCVVVRSRDVCTEVGSADQASSVVVVDNSTMYLLFVVYLRGLTVCSNDRKRDSSVVFPETW